MKLTSKIPFFSSKSKSSEEQANTSTQAGQPHSRSQAMGNMPPPRQSSSRGVQQRGADPGQQYKHTLSQKSTYPLSSEQRAEHELKVGDDGLVYQNNRRFSTGQWEESRYVMGEDGRMFADRPNRQEGVYPDNHTSFLGGKQPAAAAGEITAHGGVIETLNDSSGHYQPKAKHTKQMVDELEHRGADTSKLKTSSWS
ncbi:hypothetical protein [Burkholderia gladioli]|uniref:hypothetical protein n=1 Tax=Burkholderia gladioli TaxID=28095 RepID=UPI0016421846|nr:hypothetical protein [Burkholderia gladioli]